MTIRTDAQRTASRTNGARSRGPASPSGRLVSSRNATKHGFSGDGKHLPPDMQRQLIPEIALFSNQFHPASPYEHELIRRAALGNLRSRRLSEALLALTDSRTRSAVRDYDESRSALIDDLAALLPDDPTTALRALRQYAEGCDYLGDLCESLAQSLSTHGRWDVRQSRTFLHLLGFSKPPQPSSTEPLADLWRCALALHFQHDPRATLFHYFDEGTEPRAARHLLPAPDLARSNLLEFLHAQVATFESEGNALWQSSDLPDRQSASILAAFDPSPEAARLHRYLASAERLRRQSLDELHRLRRAQNEPDTPAPSSQKSPQIDLNPQSDHSKPASNVPPPHSSSAPEPRVQNEPRPTRPTPPASPSKPLPLAFLEALATPLPTNSTVPFAIGRPS